MTFGAPLSQPAAAAVAPLSRRVIAQVRHWAAEDSARRRADPGPVRTAFCAQTCGQVV